MIAERFPALARHWAVLRASWRDQNARDSNVRPQSDHEFLPAALEIMEKPPSPGLRYLLLGADLADPVITDFEKHVGNPEWVSLGDAIPLGKHARKLVRQYGLEPHHASEEFFKLCLDMGLSLSVALSIMRSVKQAR